MITDTIAAISTAPGMGAIGILRVSGSGTISTCLPYLHSNNNQRFNIDYITSNPRKAIACEFRKESILIDKIVFIFFKGPNSFTGEDSAELHFHGNTILLKQALNLLFKAGARPADPGEFTKRAFLNGKLDLPEAEAIGRLIHSRSQFELELAQKNFFGEISKLSSRLRSELIGIKAEFEAEIDFSTEDLTFESIEERRNRIQKISEICSSLLIKASRTEQLINRSKVVLFGEPNTGKSSLMNFLLGRERSIISHTPGTTRDYISEEMVMNGVPIQLVDTAGIRDTKDEIEKKGIEQSIREVSSANLKLFLVDVSKDIDIKSFFANNKKFLDGAFIIANKIDISHSSWSIKHFQEELHALGLKEIIPILEISCKSGHGINALIQLMEEKVSNSSESSEYILLEDRQRYHFQKILDSLLLADGLIQTSTPAEIVVKEIDEALRQVGLIMGKVSNEEVLGRIFSSFCVGK
jgi:tRNA modification GTPase